MKFYRRTLILSLTTLFLFGCKGIENQLTNLSTNINQTSFIGKALAANEVEPGFSSFNNEIKKINFDLKEGKKIDLSGYKSKYVKIQGNIQNIDFIKPENKDILSKINELDELNPENSNVSDTIKSLQSLVGEKSDGIYGKDLGNKLADKLEIVSKAINQSDGSQSSNLSPSTLPSALPSHPNNSGVANNSQNWLIFPVIAATLFSLLSVLANFLIYRQLIKSNFRLGKLEKKVQENKDELKKRTDSVENIIRTVSSKQSEIDRNLQHQRQKARVASYSNPPPPFRESEQIEFGSNMPSAQSPSPFVTSERSSYAAASPQRDYQSPKSAHEAIAQQYNTNPNAIASSAQGVSETEDSIYRRRRDSSIREVTLQNHSNHSYWVINDGEGGYWLTPIADLKLNPMNFDTFQALFQSNGEPPSGRLQLIKPAKVSQAATNQWELVEQGEVQFI